MESHLPLHLKGLFSSAHFTCIFDWTSKQLQPVTCILLLKQAANNKHSSGSLPSFLKQKEAVSFQMWLWAWSADCWKQGGFDMNLIWNNQQITSKQKDVIFQHDLTKVLQDWSSFHHLETESGKTDQCLSWMEQNRMDWGWHCVVPSSEGSQKRNGSHCVQQRLSNQTKAVQLSFKSTHSNCVSWQHHCQSFVCISTVYSTRFLLTVLETIPINMRALFPLNN